MDGKMAAKIGGLVIVGVACWHFMALWGLVLTCGIALIVLV